MHDIWFNSVFFGGQVHAIFFSIFSFLEHGTWPLKYAAA